MDATFVTDSFSFPDLDSLQTSLTMAAKEGASEGGSLNKESWPVLTLALGAYHAVTRYVTPAPPPTASPEMPQGSKLPVRPPWYEPGWQPQRPGATALRV